METKNIINIPEGFEVDKEQSTKRQIVLKSISCRPRTWEEYCEKMNGKDSYYCDHNKVVSSQFGSHPVLSEFTDKEDVEALIAFSKLLKLRKDWVGEWKPNWQDEIKKFVICNYNDKVETNTIYNTSYSLSFPTKEMRDEFLECFKDLLEQVKPLL